ncbi:hypothetical protein OCA11_05575, partial [Bacillus cereus]|nr:hypothetical protein [Bacillus cereus]MCU5183744.1 hypothetical protein [Bacillus cereus]MDZ5477814.1 hypothetical protein [Bacillus thuringiensis]
MKCLRKSINYYIIKATTHMKCTPIVRHSLTIGGAFFMAKFSSKEKIQAVKRYLDGTESGKT